MRKTIDPELSQARMRTGYFASDDSFGLQGAYHLHGPCGTDLKVIACDGTDAEARGWEHVSVSVRHRTPNWTEMCWVKDLFWEDDETVIQFHPRKSD